MQKQLSYLALGDSYTIGEAVEESQRWPVQLANELSQISFDIKERRIIANTGWTTDDLLGAIQQAMPNGEYDLVSLNIGVNNQYRGYPINQFEEEFGQLVDLAIGFSKNENDGVIVVAIPDYSVTPFGQRHAPKQIAIELDHYNRMAAQICDDKKVEFVNIVDISRKAKYDITLLSNDGLHPSGKMYSLWVERILPKIKFQIK